MRQGRVLTATLVADWRQNGPPGLARLRPAGVTTPLGSIGILEQAHEQIYLTFDGG